MLRMIKITAAIAFALCATGALGVPVVSAKAGARLKTIASRVEARMGIVTIEATDPVPYAASQPDANTFLVELRDIESAGFTDGFRADARHPIGAVRVEPGLAHDGAAVTRIRMALAQPVKPRVRSSRNMLYVEADRVDTDPSRPMISSSGPAAVIRDVRTAARGGATAVTFYATGPLTATSVEQPKDGAARLEIDLPNVSSAMPGVVPVGKGPVDRVRIGLNPRSPLVTRVVLDLTQRAAHTIEQGADRNELTVVFDGPSLLTQSSRAGVQAAAPPLAAPLPLASASVSTFAPSGPADKTVARPAVSAQAVQPMDPQAPSPSGSSARRFTGHPVSLDFQGADLRAVLRTFAEISGLNVVIDPTVQGTVDVALRDVPWDQALDIILRANKLDYVVDGTIVRIAPVSVLAAEQEERRKLSEAQALAGELRIFTRSLSYARAEEVGPLLTRTVLSSRGQIQTDARTNTLIITDLPDRITSASELLTTLDQPQPQVEIEARIVQTNRNFLRELGVQWGIGARASAALGNTLPTAFPNQGSITGRTGGNQGPPAPDPQTDAASTVVNLGANAATSGIGLALGSINGALNLDVALSALETQGQGRILSTPRVATQNNIEAEITQGIQIPIQTVANNTVTVTFKDAALTLKVTPQITAANTVIMRISLENAQADFTRAVNGIPPINTQRALTQVLVSTGETTVIGGIYVSEEQASQNRTPGLHRLPLLGWLFKRDHVEDNSRELVIFITPRIIRL